jgi:hypothetical protein
MLERDDVYVLGFILGEDTRERGADQCVST